MSVKPPHREDVLQRHSNEQLMNINFISAQFPFLFLDISAEDNQKLN